MSIALQVMALTCRVLSITCIVLVFYILIGLPPSPRAGRCISLFSFLFYLIYFYSYSRSEILLKLNEKATSLIWLIFDIFSTEYCIMNHTINIMMLMYYYHWSSSSVIAIIILCTEMQMDNREAWKKKSLSESQARRI